MMKVLFIALLVLLFIRLLTGGNRRQRHRSSDRYSGGQKPFREGEVTVEKKGSEKGSVQDVDFEELKD